MANHKTPKSKVSKNVFERESVAPTEDKEYESLHPHWRILNREDIGGDKIICDFRHFQAPNLRSFEIDLSLTIGGWDGDGIYKVPVRICDLPHVKKTIWYVTNHLLDVHNKNSSIKSEVITKVNEIKRIYSFFLRNGIYELRTVTPEIIEDLIREYREHEGWWNLLNYEGAFDEVFENALSNSDIANEICGVNNNRQFNFKHGKLERYLGLPLSGFKSVEWRDRAKNQFYPDREVAKFSENTSGLNYSVLRKICRGLNLLHFNVPGVDTIPFLPFNSELQYSLEHQVNSGFDGRTQNITPQFAVELITLCYEWIYKKAPHVISLLKTARDFAESVVEVHRDQNAYLQRDTHLRYTEMVQAHYDQIKVLAGFEWGSISVLSHPSGDISLSDLIKMVYQACFHMIGINHGRRRNEILGLSDLPYGLYLGCVSDIEPEIDLGSIRIYIEKTVQDWVEFPANKLVIDAVRILEEIYQLNRPLNTSLILVQHEHQIDQHRKLFCSRDNYGINPWGVKDSWPKKIPVVDQKKAALIFFGLLQGNYPSLVRKSHPNRRFFSCLYYYRFEFAELGALSDHFCHSSTYITNIYVQDPDTRSLGESMRTLWARELVEQDRVHKEVSQEYFEDTIKQVLDGEKVGGYFPRLIIKRMKTLSKNIEFKKLDIAGKSNKIAVKLESKGYAPNPKANGVCMAGKNKRTLKHSNCFDDGLNPQDASPSTCSGCIHLFTNRNYLRVMQEEVAELQEKSKNFRLPIYVRKQAEIQSLELIKIIDIEVSLSEENQKILADAVSPWSEQ